MMYMFAFFTTTLRFLSVTDRDSLTETLQRSYRNHTVIMQSLCNLHGLRTKIAQCPYDVRAVSLRFSQFLDPNDYLKS